ncbi:baculoviral IAP repeat-containing protein 7-like [Homarus americanus]|uniref:baculoviral IAP repeat-containing protein 7-like n=1 Tax=Homarus americanus TaxID=6706 RepID=UPI001C48021C|nr:baculoviral IAP repeat-containing protein 7-like [Homarus americanus]
MSHLQFDGVVLNQGVREVEVRKERRFHWQSELFLESVRRQTFNNWSVPFIDPKKLAKAGFFYLRTRDHVQCVFCQGIVGYWDPGDEPEVEHCKHFPNCPFISGCATGNVPICSPENDTSRLYCFLDEYHAYRLANTRPQHPTSSFQIDAVQIADSNRLAYPHLNTPSSRLQTFRRWPQDAGVSPDQLVEAGFFSTGLADWVQCFHCGGGLFSWRKGDDPLADHAHYYPFCPFIRMQQTEAVTHTWRDSSVPDIKSRPLALTDQEAELLLHHPIAKRVISMGLSQVSVQEAMRHRLQDRGILCRTVTEALEMVFDYEEDQRKKITANQPCHDGNQFPSQVVNHTPSSSPQVESSTNFCPATNTQDKLSPPLSSEHNRLMEEVENLRQQVLRAESRLLCRLCGKERVEVAFQPCSHFHLCAACARPLDSCVTCGAIIRGTLRPIIG